MNFVAIMLFTQQDFHLQCLFGRQEQLDESYKEESVHPSPLSGSFLGIGSLAFSEFCHGARNPNDVVCDRTKHWENGSKLGQK